MKNKVLVMILSITIGSISLVHADNTSDLYNLGLKYYKENDYQQAFRLFQKVADQGSGRANFFLGVMYAEGAGVKQDNNKAIEFFKKSADSGNYSSMYNLGKMFEKEGVTQDYDSAVKWYKWAATSNQIEEIAKTALVELDDKATKEYKKAANLGDTDAMYHLGWMYAQGKEGASQDYNKAIEWYQKAVDLGHVQAMNELGYIYENGQGIPQNKKQAINLYKKAVDLGNLDAKKNLSRVDPSMLAIVGKGLGKGAIAVGRSVGNVLENVVDIATSPGAVAVLQQQTTSMQRELDRQRRQEIEAKAYSARMAEERRRTTPSSSYGSSSSGLSSSASSSSDTSSSNSAGGNTNIGEINKKYQIQREKNLKVQEQKKLEQQKAYEEKLAKEQKEREEEERQREIQLANEKREKDRQAEKERKEREQLAQKQRDEQAKNNYLMNVKNSLRLKAVSCNGNNFVVGQIPKGLGFSKYVSGINVHYRAYCPSGGSYSGVSKNFIGMGAGCITGDTMSHDGGLIPKNVLSCKAEDMTVDVTNVTPTR